MAAPGAAHIGVGGEPIGFDRGDVLADDLVRDRLAQLSQQILNRIQLITRQNLEADRRYGKFSAFLDPAPTRSETAVPGNRKVDDEIVLLLLAGLQERVNESLWHDSEKLWRMAVGEYLLEVAQPLLFPFLSQADHTVFDPTPDDDRTHGRAFEEEQGIGIWQQMSACDARLRSRPDPWCPLQIDLVDQSALRSRIASPDVDRTEIENAAKDVIYEG
jgi:hypothetical protein